MSAHVLVIDDDNLVLTLVSDLLSEAGFRVSTSACGVYANHIIYGKTPPDLILLDIMMPLMSGIKKARILKQREKSRNIPIMFLSSTQDEELKRLASEANVEDYLPKPFTVESLISKVRNLLPA
jgi:DNA-binding response OmpR family regulator